MFEIWERNEGNIDNEKRKKKSERGDALLKNIN